jgi:RNA polymerase sigma-70 factor (ECF subfamily)
MVDTIENKPSPGIIEEFQRSKLALRHFISRYLVSPNDIDDVSQETFLRAYKAEGEKEQKITYPKAFIFRIAKNLMLSGFSRKAHKLTDYIDDYEQPERLACTDDLEMDVMAQQKLGIYYEALVGLPPQCRRVVIMKKLYGLQNKEIATQLQLSVSTVEKHLTKGVARTFNTIAQRYGELIIKEEPNLDQLNVKGEQR